jgi:hypothetical protein
MTTRGTNVSNRSKSNSNRFEGYPDGVPSFHETDRAFTKYSDFFLAKISLTIDLQQFEFLAFTWPSQ